MKERSRRILVLLICVWMVLSLGGCKLPGVRVDRPNKETSTSGEGDQTVSPTQPALQQNVEYTILENPRVYVTTERVKSYAEPTTDVRVKNILARNTQVTVVRFAQTAEGRWAETEEGWVQMEYLKPLDDDPHEYPIPAVVKIDLIRVREEPTSDSEQVGYFAKGEQIYILKIVENDQGKTWGQVENGWVFLDYVNLYEIAGKENYGQQNGTVVITGSPLNIREGPSSVFDVVGYLNNGDRVTISQETEINGVRWGKIKDGWICMDYVLLDKDKPKVPDPEPPADRSIIGSWLYCQDPYGFAKHHNPASDLWEFYPDGTFRVTLSQKWYYSLDYYYSWEMEMAGELYGVYTCDGSKLSMYYLEEGELLKLEEHTLKRDGGNRILNGKALLCPEYYYVYDLIASLVMLNQSSQDSFICGSWVTLQEDESGLFEYSNWIFYSDGRFEQYLINYVRDGDQWKQTNTDRMREGAYLYSNDKLTIVYVSDRAVGSEPYDYEKLYFTCVKEAEESEIVTDDLTFYEDMDFETLYQKIYG